MNPIPADICFPKHAARFWSKVEITDSCWNWIGNANKLGYGVFCFGQQRFRAHRVSLVLAGVALGELDALHKCDNPRCVRPSHLYPGTPADNASDRESRGRGNQPKGERNSHAKLTDQFVREIHAMLSTGLSDYKVAKTAGVGRDSIRRIRNGTGWKHLSLVPLPDRSKKAVVQAQRLSGHRTCHECARTLPFSQFHKNKSDALGICRLCKECNIRHASAKN